MDVAKISQIDWGICLVCQSDTEEELRGKKNDGGTEKTYDTLSKMLPQFAKLGEYSLEKFGCQHSVFSADIGDVQEELKSAFILNTGRFHHSCISKYNNQKLQRAQKRAQKTSKDQMPADEESGPSKRTRRDGEIIKLGERKCLFCLKLDEEEFMCAAGTLHATADKLDENHLKKITTQLKAQALKLNKSHILEKLATGDVKTNEIWYHTVCYKGFINSYNALLRLEAKKSGQNNEDEFHKAIFLRRIVHYVTEQRNSSEILAFEVLKLETMYKELLEIENIPYTSHSSRFGSQLKEVIPDSELRVVNGRSMLCFTPEINAVMKHELTYSSLVKVMLEVVVPIRQKMKEVKNSFQGTFDWNFQETSTPAPLVSLCSLLIDGADPREKSVSQAAKTVAQLIMYSYRKKSGNAINRRHNKERETPAPVYIGLKLYATVRAKTLIQKLFVLGISISYDRCVDICNDIATSLLEKYDRDGVFTGNSRKGLFSLIAKDNIDENSKSTKVISHFHGISMTIMQFRREECNGTAIEDTLYDLSTKSTRKLKLPESYTTFKEVPFKTGTPLYSPVSTFCIDDIYDTNEYDSATKQEMVWLESVNSSSTESCNSWSKHHSSRKSLANTTPGIHSMMPPINRKIATLEAQYHLMTIIKATIHFLNERQIPVDVSDQPLFALSKELQIRLASVFGPGKYVCMFGDLHIEQSLLVLHGQIVKGSGLDDVLGSAKLSTIGTSTIVDVNDIKRTRYCLQVSVCAIYKLLKKAHEKSGSVSSLFEWLDEASESSEMCYYWRLIMNFQIQILVFVRAVREGNFKLYVETLYKFLKWYFALDKYNYARWATIYWFDMALLEKTCPSVYDEFKSGNFTFLKTRRSFSRMALDQVHEQNNKVIKGVSGATSLLNRGDESALIRWALSGPELSKMLSDFEEQQTPETTDVQDHHECGKSFQTSFFNDVQKVVDNFAKNPFELQALTVISNTDTVFDDNVFYNIKQLESVGATQLGKYVQDRLVTCKVPITQKITLNHFVLPGDEKSKKPRGSIVDKRLTQPFLVKLRAAIQCRRDHAKMLFKTEIFGASQCLSINSTTMYHGTKSSILQKIPECNTPEHHSAPSAIIIDLSAILRRAFNASTFLEFATQVYAHLFSLAEAYDRVDVIFDRYFKNSLKKQTRTTRGNAPTISFDDNTKFPGDFRDNFLKNSSNKEKLSAYLAKKLMEFHTGEKTLVVTTDDHIDTNNSILASETIINSNTAEEADQKLVRHMIQCVQSDMAKVVIRTVDSDVVIQLLAYRHRAGNFHSKVFVCFVAGKNTTFYNINDVSTTLGQKFCEALPFFTSLTGIDAVSSFFNHGKCQFWDKWTDFVNKQALTEVFCELSEKPLLVSDEQLSILEEFICYVYYTDFSKPANIDLLRMRDFEHTAHNNLRFLPPSRNGLLQHCKRAAYEAGWVQRQCMENVELPDPTLWGWREMNDEFIPRWQEIEDPIDAIKIVTATCSCVKAKCTNCQCSKKNLECLSFCKCQRHCLYKSM